MTPNLAGFIQRHGKCFTAIVLISTAYGFSHSPSLSRSERETMAARFSFDRQELPTLPGVTFRSVREVNPSLAHISAWISSVGAAVALHDLDGDDYPNDIAYVDPRTDQAIVCSAPQGGAPARYAPFALDPSPLPFDPATMAPMGCLPGDFNEDGRADILVYYWGRTPIAFLARPEGWDPGQGAWSRELGWELTRAHYQAVEVAARQERWFTNAATQADVDGDGHVDLVFGNYFSESERILDAHATVPDHMQHSMSRAFNGGRNRLLLWQGPAQFREIDGVFEDKVARAWTLAVGAHDLDGDLLPEIYFGNDFGPDRLLHNRSTPGHPRFALLRGTKGFTTPRSKVVGEDSFKGMGVDFGDLNGDARPDVYVSNIAAEYALEESHFAWISEGDPARMRDGVAPYVDRSEPLGLSRSGWGWEARLADFDNDGVLEALQATGFVKGRADRWPELQELAIGNDDLLERPQVWPRFQPGDDLCGNQHNPFFVRARNGRFHDLAREVGLEDREVTRGIAIADVDGDGALDFAVANQWEPSFMYRNLGPRRPFLGLRLLLPVDPASPFAVSTGRSYPYTPPPVGFPAIGAAAVVKLPDGRALIGQVDGGNGHSGKRSPDLHFGLGRADHTQPNHAAPPPHVAVDLAWRDSQGAVRRRTLELRPGWHTVVLGSAAEAGTP